MFSPRWSLFVALLLGPACATSSSSDANFDATLASADAPASSSPAATNVVYDQLPTFDAAGAVQVVVEIPAGTNHKIEYDHATNTFPVDQENGRDRVITFLPYLGNYGFVPSTLMDPAEGGDGDALDVLVLAESVPTGTVMPVVPIGMLSLRDGGEIDDKIIAVPADADRQIIKVNDVSELAPAVRSIVETWFTSYKGPGRMESLGWQDAAAARKSVTRWQVGK